jgi:hypothetical protein
MSKTLLSDSKPHEDNLFSLLKQEDSAFTQDKPRSFLTHFTKRLLELRIVGVSWKKKEPYSPGMGSYTSILIFLTKGLSYILGLSGGLWNGISLYEALQILSACLRCCTTRPHGYFPAGMPNV